jgi:putative sigma-54 modulation protein
MRIEIHTGAFSLTESLREHIERRIRSAFGRLNQGLQKVSLRLDDINGPKGGADKSCRIQIPLPGSRPVVIEETQADLYIAIDRALERAGQALGRKLARKREHGRARLTARLADDPNLNHS